MVEPDLVFPLPVAPHARVCTLIVSVRQHPSTPLVVAANRDEQRGRPATAPRRWPGERFVAPRDERAGGTWLGLTTTGLFVGVTNRFPSLKDPARASRGALVVEALRARSAEALRAQLAALEVGRFNPFHLLYADASAAFVTWSDGERVRHEALEPGLHVVTERSLGGDDEGRAALVRARWPGLARDAEGVPTHRALEALLAERHPGGGVGSVCVDLPAWDYGSRSALVLLVRPELGRSRWFWAEGRPDATPFVEQPGLIAALTG